MKKVLVLMSTYNGEEFICEQIESILNQDGVEVCILIRDDGSKDSTVKILESYRDIYTDKIILKSENNVGCKESFFNLLREAKASYSGYDYYAFADQDDIWLNDKLISGVRALDQENNPYRLYYCDPQIVDRSLNPIDTKGIPSLNTLGESFILQPCIGCSMIFSPGVLELSAIHDSSQINIHDAWVYKIALAFGGKVIHDKSKHILYRQHGLNTIGGNQNLLDKWRRRFNSFIDNKRYRSAQAKILLDNYSDVLPLSSVEVLTMIADYHGTLRKKMRIISDDRFKGLKKSHSLMFKIAILFDRI